MKLEKRRPSAAVRGLLPWHGTAACTILHRGQSSRESKESLHRDDQPLFEVAESGLSWGIVADGALCRVFSEAQRIGRVLEESAT